MPEIVPTPEEFLPRVPDRCIPDHYRVSPVRLTPEGARRIEELKALAEASALESRTLEPPLQAIPREDLEVLLREVQVEGASFRPRSPGPAMISSPSSASSPSPTSPFSCGTGPFRATGWKDRAGQSPWPWPLYGRKHED